MDRFSGIERLYGAGSLARLQTAKIAVVGLGGVGSWCVEALARSGVGTLRLIDMDEVAPSNTNRQLPALTGTFGRLKAEILSERCQAINPAIHIEVRPVFLNEQNIERLLTEDLDFVIDAIDQVSAKSAILHHCLKQSLPLAVCGASGGKTDPTAIVTSDLAAVQGDPLLKSLKRHALKHYQLAPSTLKDVPSPAGIETSLQKTVATGTTGTDLQPTLSNPSQGTDLPDISQPSPAFATPRPKAKTTHAATASYGVSAVWSRQPSVKPDQSCFLGADADFNPAGGIECGRSYGSASFVTGSFGLVLASLAVNYLAPSATG